MRKETLKVVSAFIEQRKCKGKNTVSTGKALKLFGNKIAWRDGFSLYVTLAGYNTVTTHERLNGLMELIRAPLRFGKTKGVPVLRNLNMG